ncbi:Uncharacterized conserved protein [Phaffia rhodozyma]|uniref:Uncharacterized conserved protein n=1 Tax=Phaffia rhodozyma TaxID=264483 RepID=A0A0F7SU49_PHARH|nr:Uncharacterized conserved protein [Phaffia rhodozyma]
MTEPPSDQTATDGPISLWVGISIGLVSSFVQSLGLTIQRKSHTINQQAHPDNRKVEWKRPLWLIGFAIFITSNVLGTIFQVGALPIVVLAPLGAISLLWNALFARFLLGDSFTRFMILGTILITTGAILIATFGVVPEPSHTIDDLVRLFGRPQWTTYISILAAAVVLALVTSHILEHFMWKRIDSQPGPIQLPVSPSLGPTRPLPSTASPSKPCSDDGTSSESPCAPNACSSPERRTQLLLSLSYAAISGTLSGLCLLIAKSAIELLLITISHPSSNQFNSLTTVYLVVSLVILALAQLIYLNKALRLASPTAVCPVAFSFYNVSSVFGGLVYFNQLNVLTDLSVALVCVGVAVLLAGVGVVSLTGEKGAGGVDVGVWVEEAESEIDETGYRDDEDETNDPEEQRRRLLNKIDYHNPWKVEEEGEEEEASISQAGARTQGSGLGLGLNVNVSPEHVDNATLSPSSSGETDKKSRPKPTLSLIHPSRRSSTDAIPTSFPSPLSPSTATSRRSSVNSPRRYIPSSHFPLSPHLHHHHSHSQSNSQHNTHHSHPEDGMPVDFAPHAVFSIGLGAASPGFKLRGSTNLTSSSGSGSESKRISEEFGRGVQG